MTTRIMLVRHGETDSNAEGRTQGLRDVPLNAFGRRQAAALAEMLRNHDLAAVVSSPSTRAFDTASAVAQVHGLTVAVDARWQEMDQGILDGLTGGELRHEHADFLRRWRDEDPTDLRMPGGETLREVQQRAVAATEDLAARYPDAAVAVVTHNFTSRTILCHAIGVPLASFRRLRQDLCSLSVVEVRPDAGWSVAVLNDGCHLPLPDAS